MAKDPIQQRITNCWNSAGGGYDQCPGHGLRDESERRAWQQVLASALPDPPADVLDVGTGTGFIALRAHELGHRVTGIDLAENMLAVAQAAAASLDRPPVFAIGDAAAPAFPPASFDAITNRHLLWTLQQPGEAIRNWRELLRPGGRIVVIDAIHPPDDEPRDPNEQEEESHGGEDFYTAEVVARLPLMHARSADEIAALIEAAGFTQIAPIDFAPVVAVEEASEWTARRYGFVALRT